MKNFTKKEKAFINPEGRIEPFAFEIKMLTSGKYGNYEVVEQMAKDGDQQAVSAIEKLKDMTSRQRSESGIYYKLQQKPLFNETKGKLYGVTPFESVIVTYSSEFKPTKSRIKCFERNAQWFTGVFSSKEFKAWGGISIIISQKIEKA